MFKKRLYLNTIGALSLVGAFSLHAPLAAAGGIPTVDVPNLVEQFSGHLQDARNWAEEKALARLKNELDSQLSAMQIDNANNIAANIITRLGRNDEQIKDKELQQDLLPDFDACKTGGVQSGMENTKNAVIASKTAENKRYKQVYENLKDRGDMHIRQSELEKVILAACEELGTSDDGIACVNGDLLLGSTGDTYNEKEDKAAQLLVEILAGAEVASADKPALSESDGSRLHKRRNAAVKRIVQESLNDIRYQRVSVNGRPSQLQLINEFVDQRFGTPKGQEFLQVISNTHPLKNDNPLYQTTPEQVLRKMAVMDAFLVYMEGLKYKQQVRNQTLMTMLLALEAEPLVNDPDRPGGS